MKQTLINLLQAYVGESQARNRYSFYSKIAIKEGYEQIGAIFAETEEQERTHGKTFLRLFKELQAECKDPAENMVMLDAVPVPVEMSNTKANLKAAVEGETHEWKELYPQFAEVAEKEGFKKVAAKFRAIAKAEKHHQERYSKLLAELEAGTVLKKAEKILWVCRECGYVHEGTEPPHSCPSCDHPPAFFQRLCENY
jgi:rubrerythrin